MIGYFSGFCLLACDPIYNAELRNNYNDTIEVKFCGPFLSDIDYEKKFEELSADKKDCRIFKLWPKSNIEIAISSGVATPIELEDLGFKEIQLTTPAVLKQVKAEEVMKMFQIKPVTNIIGIQVSKTYEFEVGP